VWIKHAQYACLCLGFAGVFIFLNQNYDFSMRSKTIFLSLLTAVLLSGCAGSSSSDSAVEEAYTPPPKPVCTDKLEPKKIDRNGDAYKDMCGTLYVKVIDAQTPDACQVRVDYDTTTQGLENYSNYESYMGFYNCEDAKDFYTGDTYKVTARVNGTFTFKTVMGASRTLADLTIIDVLSK
jgi:hypothetical protein